MKYLVLVGDGMADLPCIEGRTPLEVADTPNLDMMAARGSSGTARTVPPGFPAGSDIANLSILGYRPERYYTGRGPLEAAGNGVKTGDGDVIFRCNLITQQDGVIKDYSGGHLTTAEGRLLVEALNQELATGEVRFYPGVGYRHILVLKERCERVLCTPPHDALGRSVREVLPQGGDAGFLVDLIERSAQVLEGHEVNLARVADGCLPANLIWPWGQGRPPSMPSFYSLHCITGAVISAVDLLRGVARYAKMGFVEVEGATGYLDTNYEGKAMAALEALETWDLVYLHLEAPDEASHQGDLEGKLRAIENFDRLIVGRILDRLEQECRFLVLPDHPTPLALKTHTDDPVPFIIYPADRPDDVRVFSEREAEKGCFGRLVAPELIKLLKGRRGR